MKCSLLAMLVTLSLMASEVHAQTTLFDGTSLEGWTRVGKANWHLSDGALEATSGNGHLVSASSYSDFMLTLEFWVDDPANSGVFIRCQSREDISPDTCYEVNIYDQREDPTYRTGGIVNIAAPEAQIDAGGRWNTYEIRADGERLTITLNGIVTVDVEDSTHSEGPFTLQYGGGIVKFRNVQIQEL